MTACLMLLLCSVVLGDTVSVEKHLELGKKFLQEGQLSDALHHYSAACGETNRKEVARDPAPAHWLHRTYNKAHRIASKWD